MDRSNLGSRFALIVLAVGLAAWSAYPPGESIKLGLDLRGGSHLVLQVETDDALRAETGNDMDYVQQLLEDEGVTGVQVERTSDTSFKVTGVAPEKAEELKDSPFLKDTWDAQRSDGALVFTMRTLEENNLRDLAVRQALQTIRNRIDAFGVAEPVVHREGIGGDRIVVQMPGVDDPQRVKDLIKNTAFLELRLLREGTTEADSLEQLRAALGGTIPPDVEVLPQLVYDEARNVVGRTYLAVEQRQVVTGRDLKDARPSADDFNQPAVSFTLTREGGRKFADVTAANVGRRLAIILDNTVMSAPVIESRISDSGIIRGDFTQQEATDLVTVLKSGALPAGLTYLEDRSVGPTLGRDSIAQGQRAGLIGGLLVVLTMLVVYKLTGLNAVLALALNIVLIFGALAIFGATLTLPGIAGIVLTVGMAVDANVLVFERIREELRAGRTVKSAIVAGFSKALSSIVDGNLTTLIAAMFLFLFGTGPIRGFAVTLSVGILASVFTAVFVSRWIFDLLHARRPRVEKLSI
ncbi:MAG TPA: protein translocase subunit SecD [Thermoanaerobaculia bacterium]|jgi:preprotein translocase subunit SecD